MNVNDYIAMGMEALNAGEYEAAGKIFTDAKDLFPENFLPGYWMGNVLLRQQKLDEAFVVFNDVIEHFPTVSYGYVGRATIQIFKNEFAKAELTLEAGIEKCGYEYWLGFNYAQCAERMANFSAAKVRWETLSHHTPSDAYALGRWARTLVTLGDLDTARALMGELTPELSAHIQVRYAQAMLKSAEGQPKEALQLWRALREEYPNDLEIQTAWGHAEQAQKFTAASGPGSEEEVHKHILLRFVSMGEDCEFGLMQRHYGLEPLGLLRWASVKPEKLAALLDDGISAIGVPANTRLTISESQGVYYLEMPQYNLAFNTMFKAHTVDEAVFIVEQNKRTKFLARQIVDQFEDGEKIFVFKQNGHLNKSAAIDLWTAIQKYGDSKLLYVAEAADDKDIGSIDVINPRLMIGALRGLGAGAEGWKIPYDAWLKICEKAAERFDAAGV